MEYEHAHQTVLVGLALSHQDSAGDHACSVMGCPCLSPEDALELLTAAIARIHAEGLTHDTATASDDA